MVIWADDGQNDASCVASLGLLNVGVSRSLSFCEWEKILRGFLIGQTILIVFFVPRGAIPILTGVVYGRIGVLAIFLVKRRYDFMASD